MKLNNGQEVRVALKLKEPSHKWDIYGSVYCDEAGTYYRRHYVLPKDCVKNLFYVEPQDGMDAWMGARRCKVDYIESGNLKVSCYSMGKKSWNKTEKIYEGTAWPYEFIAEEQSNEVLYELYKKGVFVDGYAKKEVFYLLEEMKKSYKLIVDKYRPQVEQAIRDGKAKIEAIVDQARDGVDYYQLKCQVNNLSVCSFGFARDKDSLYKEYWDDFVMSIAKNLGFVPKNEGETYDRPT